MNKEQAKMSKDIAIHNLKVLKAETEEHLKDLQALENKIDEKDFIDYQAQMENEKCSIQALDIAIESLQEDILNEDTAEKIVKGKADEIEDKKQRETLKRLYELVEQNKWVDVKDRLPQPNGTDEYLVCDNDGLIYVASYEKNKDGTCEWYGGKGTDDYAFYCIDILAWKPLPEPYVRSE